MDPKIFTDMFTLAIPVLEKIIRPIIVYVALIVGLRLAGKRELAQLNPLDLIVLLTLSNTVQNAIIGDDNSVTGGLIGAATLLLVNYLFVRIIYQNRKIETLVEGSEDILINHGRLNKKLLDSDVISLQELTVAARRQGFESLEDIDRAVLEPDGGISITGKKSDTYLIRHQEILAHLEALSVQVTTLQSRLDASTGQE